MRILFTCLSLAWRSGSEMHVHDLATGLAGRGHAVTVFTPTIGELADETRARGVAVVDELTGLGGPPDIIHANHVLPIAEALLAFPKTPTLWTCHDWLAWHDEPPSFPQILRYAGVDELCRERILQAGIERARTMILPNTVDLSRFRARSRPMPSKPRSALVFGKAHAIFDSVAKACAEIGLHLTSIHAGNEASGSKEPEKRLPDCDLVFATARAASEALACGCSVVLADARGFGGPVTTDAYEHMRDYNFGLRCLTAPVTTEAMASAIAAYNPADATAVSARHRRERDLEGGLDLLERTYAEVLAEAETWRFDSEAWTQALGCYLRQFTPHASAQKSWPWSRERDALLARIAELEQNLTDSTS